MMMNKLPTLEFLKECFDYDVKTGELLWRERPMNHFPDITACEVFNRRLAGSVAGSKNGKGYFEVIIDGGKFLQHRIIWPMFYGWNSNMQIDHIDGNGMNNKINNLRLVTPAGNLKNKKTQKNNATGITGVYMAAIDKRWYSKIKVDRKIIHLYCGFDFFEACCVRKSAERKYGFHPNHGRKMIKEGE